MGLSERANNCPFDSIGWPLVSAHHKLVGLTEGGQRVGETHHRAKLTERDVELILQMHAWGLSYRQIADKMDDIPGGVSKSTVRDIVKGLRRCSAPDHWRKA